MLSYGNPRTATVFEPFILLDSTMMQFLRVLSDGLQESWHRAEPPQNSTAMPTDRRLPSCFECSTPQLQLGCLNSTKPLVLAAQPLFPYMAGHLAANRNSTGLGTSDRRNLLEHLRGDSRIVNSPVISFFPRLTTGYYLVHTLLILCYANAYAWHEM